MPLNVMVGPLRYVQGPDALLQLGSQLQVLGIGNPLILASPSAKKAVSATLSEGLDACGIPHAYTEFQGECSWAEIERVRNVCLAGGHDAIVNCGGGKTIDAGRAAAAKSGLNVQKTPPEPLPSFGAGVACINVPTVAATDASTSAVSLIYDERHTVEAVVTFPTNPVMVLADTTVIARSPVRLLVAGMGDALATHFEAEMCFRTGAPAVVTRHHGTRATRALTSLCLELLLTYGVQGKLEAEQGIAGPGLEAVVEANILLSGLGFESGGISASHAVGHGFYHVADLMEVHQYHGELVAYGVLTQLMLEQRPPEFLDTVFGFCRSVGLPTTLAELTLTDTSEPVLERVALAAVTDPGTIPSFAGAFPEPDEQGRFFDHRLVLNAIRAVDAYGRDFAARS